MTAARSQSLICPPGLTHHYAGLSFGNEASTRYRYRVSSNPQLAAKQG